METPVCPSRRGGLIWRRLAGGSLSRQFSAGQVEPGESPEDVAVRETSEEAASPSRSVSCSHRRRRALTRIAAVEKIPRTEPDGRGSVQVEHGPGIRAPLKEHPVALLPKRAGARDGQARNVGEADLGARRQLVRREPGRG